MKVDLFHIQAFLIYISIWWVVVGGLWFVSDCLLPKLKKRKKGSCNESSKRASLVEVDT